MKSKLTKATSTLSLFCFSMSLSNAVAQSGSEPHKLEVVKDVITAVSELSKESEKPVLALAFWDFDGTILSGDCSEGLKIDGKVIYDGLVKQSIEHGFSGVYKAEGGFKAFWQDYQYIDERCGHWLSYPFIPQMLKGAKEADVRQLAAREFEKTYSKYYFSSSLTMLNQLEEKGIKNYIISASADVFVKEAASSLKLPRSRFYGIKQQAKSGLLTEKLVYPVTYAEGKRECLQAIVKEVQSRNPTKKVIAIAAFGNSYSTDGAFMEFVAQQEFKAGSPIAVMINGGKSPSSYKGIFREVSQSQIRKK